MATARRDFFFRNRRWLLFLLFLLVLAFLAPFRDPTAERLARFLSHYAPVVGLAAWRHAVYALAAVLLGLGAFWRTWGSAYLGANVVQDRRMHTDRLVGDGPYRRTRNPLYFGNMLMVLGLGFLLAPASYAILVIGMWVLVRLFIRDEEAGFEASSGESYRSYRSAVPRMLPSWRPLIPAAGARPRWLQGFCGEIILWVLATVLAGMAVTLDRRWLGLPLLWGFVIAIPLFLWARRSSKRQTTPAGPS